MKKYITFSDWRNPVFFYYKEMRCSKMIRDIIKERINYIYINKRIEFLVLIVIGLVVR